MTIFHMCLTVLRVQLKKKDMTLLLSIAVRPEKDGCLIWSTADTEALTVMYIIQISGILII